MKAVETEVLKWDSTKKQRQFLEVGDVRNCLKASQRRFYLNSLYLAVVGLLCAVVAISRIKKNAGDLTEFQWLEVSILLLMAILSGVCFGYQLAKSRLKRQVLETMIESGEMSSTEPSPPSV